MKYLFSIIIALIIAIALHIIPSYFHIKTDTANIDIKNAAVAMFQKANKVISKEVIQDQIPELEFNALCQSLKGLYGYKSITTFFIFQSGNKICCEPKVFKYSFYSSKSG